VDRNATGRIIAVDLLNFLRDHHSHAGNEAELHFLVRFFDCDNDGALNFQE
jgi:Ca2+-binding EF-hand superfamily protein